MTVSHSDLSLETLTLPQEDTVAKWLDHFNDHCLSALVGLLRSAAGCRWAIRCWTELDCELQTEGTWYGASQVGAIQLQGQSACLDELYFYEEAFTTYIDCLAYQPNPKQKDIDKALDRRNVPPALQEREVPLWPRNRDECRARKRRRSFAPSARTSSPIFGP